MDPNALVREIVAAFRELEQELVKCPNQIPHTNTEWTQLVLNALCKLGRKLGYTARAKNNGSEWLYDACWQQFDDCNRLISVPMVAESEWNPLKEVEYDFQKLLLAKSAVRVIVCHTKRKDGGAEGVSNLLCEHVGAFNDACGDTYLLIAYVDDSETVFKFKFSTIIAQDHSNLPIIQTL